MIMLCMDPLAAKFLAPLTPETTGKALLFGTATENRGSAAAKDPGIHLPCPLVSHIPKMSRLLNARNSVNRQGEKRGGKMTGSPLV